MAKSKQSKSKRSGRTYTTPRAEEAARDKVQTVENMVGVLKLHGVEGNNRTLGQVAEAALGMGFSVDDVRAGYDGGIGTTGNVSQHDLGIQATSQAPVIATTEAIEVSVPQVVSKAKIVKIDSNCTCSQGIMLSKCRCNPRKNLRIKMSDTLLAMSWGEGFSFPPFLQEITSPLSLYKRDVPNDIYHLNVPVLKQTIPILMKHGCDYRTIVAPNPALLNQIRNTNKQSLKYTRKPKDWIVQPDSYIVEKYKRLRMFLLPRKECNANRRYFYVLGSHIPDRTELNTTYMPKLVFQQYVELATKTLLGYLALYFGQAIIHFLLYLLAAFLMDPLVLNGEMSKIGENLKTNLNEAYVSSDYILVSMFITASYYVFRGFFDSKERIRYSLTKRTREKYRGKMVEAEDGVLEFEDIRLNPNRVGSQRDDPEMCESQIMREKLHYTGWQEFDNFLAIFGIIRWRVTAVENVRYSGRLVDELKQSKVLPGDCLHDVQMVSDRANRYATMVNHLMGRYSDFEFQKSVEVARLEAIGRVNDTVLDRTNFLLVGRR